VPMTCLSRLGTGWYTGAMISAFTPLSWLGFAPADLPALPLQDWFRAARGLAFETERAMRIHALMLRLVASYRAQAFVAPVLPDSANRALLELIHARGADDVRSTVVALHGALLKVAQLLSTRADILPEAYTRALSPLQDRVPPRPYAEIAATLDQELGERLTAFTWIDERPLASASIAQVHRAQLVSGEDVVIKVQYRRARRLLRADLAALTRGAWLMDQAFPPSKQSPLAEELASHIAREVDFVAEAASAQRMRASFAGEAVPGVRVPEVLPELSSAKVLTMEYVAGERLGDVLNRLRAERDSVAIEQLLTRLVQAYCHQIVRCGFFQADPHPGNFIVEPGGGLALIDFGCCKEFSAERRNAFVNLGSAMMMGHAPSILHWLREAGFTTADAASEERLAKIAALLARQVASGRFDEEITPEQAYADFVANLGIHPPTDAALLGRVFLALGGLLRTYAPRLNLPAIIAPVVIAAALQSAPRATSQP